MSNKKVKITHVADLVKPTKKYLYLCYCNLCKGEEVDSRTQEKHTREKNLWKSEEARKRQENVIVARKQKKASTPTPLDVTSKKRKRVSHYTPNSNPNPFQDFPQLLNEVPPQWDNEDFLQLDNEEHVLPSNPSHFRIPASTLENNSDNYFDEENDSYDDNVDQENDEDNIEDFFASPEFNDEEIFGMESLNDSIDTEIIIWLFKF